jgi:hypothetical protein
MLLSLLDLKATITGATLAFPKTPTSPNEPDIEVKRAGSIIIGRTCILAVRGMKAKTFQR